MTAADTLLAEIERLRLARGVTIGALEKAAGLSHGAYRAVRQRDQVLQALRQALGDGDPEPAPGAAEPARPPAPPPPGATVDHLAAVAMALAVRVRDEGPEENAAWLLEQLPDPADWFRLNFMSAIAMPVQDRSWDSLVAWARDGETPTPVHLPATARAVLAGRSEPMGVRRENRARVAELDAQRLPPEVIAERIGITTRSVYRHLQALAQQAAQQQTPEQERTAA